MILAFAAPALALTLTYEDALRRAGERNAEVLGATQDVVVAEATLLAARGTYEPYLSGNGSWFTSAEEGTNPQFGETYSEASGWSGGLSLTQPMATGTSLTLGMDASRSSYLFRGELQGFEFESEEEGGVSSSLSFTLTQSLLQGHRIAWNLQGVRGARAARSVAEAGRQAARQQALADTATAFWAARYQRALVAIAEQTLAVAKEQRRVVDALVDGGKLAPVEATRAHAAEVGAERALLQARHASAAADDALLAAVGEPLGEPLELAVPTPAVPEVRLDAEAVVEAALQGNPELVAARLGRDEARATLADKRHGLLPSLDASVSHGVQGYDGTLPASLGDALGGERPSWTVGASLTVPLYNRADRGALLAAQGELAKAEIDLNAAEVAMAAQVRAQVRTLEDAARAVELARLDVRLAEETLAADQARLAEGRALQKDVSDALRALDQARAEAERAVTSYLVAVVVLERLKGSL